MEDTNRVTAGLPAVTPELRNKRDTVERTRALSDAALAEEKHAAEASASADGGHPTTSLAAQLGRPMATAEFQRRVTKCNRSLHFERSIAYPRLAGVYALETRPDPVTRRWDLHKRFICGMEADYMPEFTVRHVELRQQPDPQIPGAFREFEECVDLTMGWRTVLARLVHERLISTGQCERYFGIPTRDSRLWQIHTT